MSAPGRVRSMDELRSLAAKSKLQQFVSEVGPFLLVRRPPEPELQAQFAELGATRTSSRRRGPDSAVSVVLEFMLELDDLVAQTAPRRAVGEPMVVGRDHSADVPVEEPSVSKRHAQIEWSARYGAWRLLDLQSTNGTFVNEEPVLQEGAVLADGDVLAFGDADFWFVLAPTLYERLHRP